MENKEITGPGKFVKYSYRLYDAADGKLLFETPKGEPDEMIYGVSQEVVPGLIAALKDLGKGDRFDVTLPPAAAFGERYDENVADLERQIFERDGQLAEEVKTGAELPMMTAEGFRILGRVLEITDSHVKMDFNHPFAGKTVRFEGTVDEVRDATPEELKPATGCCGGHCGNNCDDGDGHCGCHNGDDNDCGCHNGDDNDCGCHNKGHKDHGCCHK